MNMEINMDIDMDDFVKGVHYIAIGGAANIDYKESPILHPSEWHEYPEFIQDIKRKRPNIPLTIWLIDPSTELIPNCIHNEYVHNIPTRPEPEWTNVDNKGVRFVHDDGIVINVVRKLVTYYPRTMADGCVDITAWIALYRKKCIDTHSILIVHDYSGVNNISELDDSFPAITDDAESDVHSRVIFDITSGVNYQGTVDLCNESHVPYITYTNDPVEGPWLHIFNPRTLLDSHVPGLYEYIQGVVNSENDEDEDPVLDIKFNKAVMFIARIENTLTKLDDIYNQVMRVTRLITDNTRVSTKKIKIAAAMCRKILSNNHYEDINECIVYCIKGMISDTTTIRYCVIRKMYNMMCRVIPLCDIHKAMAAFTEGDGSWKQYLPVITEH